MEQLNYKPAKASRVMRFFWRAAGGDEFILNQSTYSDQIKYFCLGGIVIATALMASLSGGYAFYTIFSPKGYAADKKEIITNGITQYVDLVDPSTAIIALIFGVVWGLIIFNLDRFIVASTGQGDGTEAITWDELKSAIPRIIMGIIIAITISKPVEIRILQSEIDHHLQTVQQDEKQKALKIYYEDIDNQVSDIDEEILEKREEKDVLNERWAELNQNFADEVMGENSSADGYGPKAKALETQMESVMDLIESKQADIDILIAEKKALQTKKEGLDKEQDMKVSGFDGLAERIEIAHDHYPGVSLFITLLFLAIELTPIFFKLMLIKSPYDYISDNYKAIEIAKHGIYIEAEYYEDKEGKQRELVRSLEAEKMTAQQKELLEAQNRIMKYAIAKFEEEEKKKVDSNPQDYINYKDDKKNS